MIRTTVTTLLTHFAFLISLFGSETFTGWQRTEAIDLNDIHIETWYDESLEWSLIEGEEFVNGSAISVTLKSFSRILGATSENGHYYRAKVRKTSPDPVTLNIEPQNSYQRIEISTEWTDIEWGGTWFNFYVVPETDTEATIQIDGVQVFEPGKQYQIVDDNPYVTSDREHNFQPSGTTITFSPLDRPDYPFSHWIIQSREVHFGEQLTTDFLLKWSDYQIEGVWCKPGKLGDLNVSFSADDTITTIKAPLPGVATGQIMRRFIFEPSEDGVLSFGCSNRFAEASVRSGEAQKYWDSSTDTTYFQLKGGDGAYYSIELAPESSIWDATFKPGHVLLVASPGVIESTPPDVAVPPGTIVSFTAKPWGDQIFQKWEDVPDGIDPLATTISFPITSYTEIKPIFSSYYKSQEQLGESGEITVNIKRSQQLTPTYSVEAGTVKAIIPNGYDHGFKFEIDVPRNSILTYHLKVELENNQADAVDWELLFDEFVYLQRADPNSPKPIGIPFQSEWRERGDVRLTLSQFRIVENSTLFKPKSYQGGRLELSNTKPYYQIGEEVELHAIPDDGYWFSKWKGSLISNDQKVTIKVQPNMEITSIFGKSFEIDGIQFQTTGEYHFTPIPNPNQAGRFLIKLQEAYHDSENKLQSEAYRDSENAMASLAVTNATRGNIFAFRIKTDSTLETTGRISNHFNGSQNIRITQNWRDVQLQADKTFFQIDFNFIHLIRRNYFIDPQLLGSPIQVDADPEKGRVTLQPNKELYEKGETVIITAEPNPGYRFQKWNGDSNSTTQQITTTVDEDKSFAALFEVDDSNNSELIKLGDGDRTGISWYETSTGFNATWQHDSSRKGELKRSLTFKIQGPGKLKFDYQDSAYENGYPKLDGIHLPREHNTNSNGQWEILIEKGEHTLSITKASDKFTNYYPTSIISNLKIIPGYEIDIDRFEHCSIYPTPVDGMFPAGTNVIIDIVSPPPTNKFIRWSGTIATDVRRTTIKANNHHSIQPIFGERTQWATGEPMERLYKIPSFTGYGDSRRTVKGSRSFQIREKKDIHIPILVEGLTPGDYAEINIDIDGVNKYHKRLYEDGSDAFDFQSDGQDKELTFNHETSGSSAKIKIADFFFDKSIDNAKPLDPYANLEWDHDAEKVFDGDIIEFRIPEDAPEWASIVVTCQEEEKWLIDYDKNQFPIKSLKYLVHGDTDGICISDSATNALNHLHRFKLTNIEKQTGVYREGREVTRLKEESDEPYFDTSDLGACLLKFSLRIEKGSLFYFTNGPNDSFQGFTIVGTGNWQSVQVAIPASCEKMGFSYTNASFEVDDFRLYPGYGVSFWTNNRGSLRTQTNQPVHLKGEAIRYEAMPNEDYEFTVWEATPTKPFNPKINVIAGEDILILPIFTLKSKEERNGAKYTLRGTLQSEGRVGDQQTITLEPNGSYLDVELEGPGVLYWRGNHFQASLNGVPIDPGEIWRHNSKITIEPGHQKVRIQNGTIENCVYVPGYSVDLVSIGVINTDPYALVKFDPKVEALSIGDKVTVTAFEDDEHQFIKWEGDINSNQRSLELEISQNIRLRAIYATRNFQKREWVTIIPNNDGTFTSTTTVTGPGILTGESIVSARIDEQPSPDGILGSNHFAVPEGTHVIEIVSQGGGLIWSEGYGLIIDSDSLPIRDFDGNHFGSAKDALMIPIENQGSIKLIFDGPTINNANENLFWYGSAEGTGSQIELKTNTHNFIGLRTIKKQTRTLNGVEYVFKNLLLQDIEPNSIKIPTHSKTDSFPIVVASTTSSHLSANLDPGIYITADSYIQVYSGSAQLSGLNHFAFEVLDDDWPVHFNWREGDVFLGLERAEKKSFVPPIEYVDSDKDGTNDLNEYLRGSDTLTPDQNLKIEYNNKENQFYLIYKKYTGFPIEGDKLYYWIKDGWDDKAVYRSIMLEDLNFEWAEGDVFDTYKIDLKQLPKEAILFKTKSKYRYW